MRESMKNRTARGNSPLKPASTSKATAMVQIANPKRNENRGSRRAAPDSGSTDGEWVAFGSA